MVLPRRFRQSLADESVIVTRYLSIDTAWRVCEQLVRHEGGIKLERYRDTGGVWTVGAGHTGHLAQMHESITIDEALVALLEDLETAIGDAALVIPNYHDLSEVRKASFVRMAFNLGRSNLLGFGNMIRELDNRPVSWRAVSREMIDSAWASDPTDDSRAVGFRAWELAACVRLDRWVDCELA